MKADINDTLRTEGLDAVRARHDRARKFDGAADNLNKAPAPQAVTHSEDALALEFTRRHGADWRYVASWGSWLQWDGCRWQFEDTLKAFDLARNVCRDDASNGKNKRTRNKLSTAGTVAAVVTLARADRTHAATNEIWDTDPWLLNTPGGSVDLKTGKLRAHDRADHCTHITTATPRGDCPQWRDFLMRITAGDAELASYLQRVVGYCLTGSIREHALFFLYGTGANGKGVFVNTLASILSDYASVAPVEMFMATANERHPTDMASLRGARFVSASETEQGRRWAESKVKALTGGDRITARFMRQDSFEFIPEFKLLFAGNHKPQLRSVDEAIRRRLHLVPFTVTIPAGERDATLTKKLAAEHDGILAWAVAGCLEWQRIGLAPPEAVTKATEAYFEAEDTIGRWLEEACELGGGYTETTAALYQAFKQWAEVNGEYQITKRTLSMELDRRGFARNRNNRARGLIGLRLRSGGTPGDASDR
jgi:putative DNA primase/helicase